MKPDPPHFGALSIGGKCPKIKGSGMILSYIPPTILKLVVEDIREAQRHFRFALASRYRNASIPSPAQKARSRGHCRNGHSGPEPSRSAKSEHAAVL